MPALFWGQGWARYEPSCGGRRGIILDGHILDRWSARSPSSLGVVCSPVCSIFVDLAVWDTYFRQVLLRRSSSGARATRFRPRLLLVFRGACAPQTVVSVLWSSVHVRFGFSVFPEK